MIKTILTVLLSLVAYTEAASATSGTKNKRGYYGPDVVLAQNLLQAIPYHGYDLSGGTIVHKPIVEPQDPQIPIQLVPLPIGGAAIPPIPPPATPVNVVAANVPISGGAVYLGSGSLGVISLGNGAYALGSGSLGYSMNRAQPRSSISAPLFPPLIAAPNLVPAAVVSQQFQQPPLVPNAHGYEYLPRSRVAFGMPPARLPQFKNTQLYATPTNLLVRPPGAPPLGPAPVPIIQPVPQVPSIISGYTFDIPTSVELSLQ